MKKTVPTLVLLTAISLIGCKSSKNTFILDEATAKKSKTTLLILNDLAKNTQNFETVTIRGTAVYHSDSQNEKVSVDIVIEKDKQILINIRYKGFPVGKALFSPDNIRYYEKLNSTFFDGDYNVLTRLTGLELQFHSLQNLLLGQPIDTKIENGYTAKIENGFYKVSPLEEENIRTTYYFEGKNSLLKKEEITDAISSRKVTITYPNYQKINDFTVPAEIHIETEQDKNIGLKITYANIIFNELRVIKYKVPNDYKRIY